MSDPFLDSNPRLALLLLLALAVAAVYAPVAGYDFVNYDDDHYVYANEPVKQGITLRGLVTAFTGTTVGHWHPLTTLSHMLDVELFGMNAGRHHLVNVAIHALNAMLLFGVLLLLTAAPLRSVVVAALFALHPINVESVAWITQRKSLLSTTLWLLAIIAYATWVRRRRALDYGLLLAAFVAGLMFKVMIVTLPATLLALDIWPLRRIGPDGLRSADGRRQLVALLAEKLPLFAVSGASAVSVIVTQRAADAITPSDQFPLVERLLNACVSYLWYLQKAVWPVALTVVNPHPASVGALVSRPVALLSLVFFTACSVVAVRSAARRPYLLAGLAWYFVTLLPVSGIIQVGGNAQGDHFAYVPLIGIFVALVWLVDEFLPARRFRRAAMAATVALLVAFSFAARAQLRTWRNSETLFLRAMEIHRGERFIARKNLAAHYAGLAYPRKVAGDLPGALALYRRAAELYPDAGVLYNQAAVLSDLERYADAIPLYERSLALQPDHPDGWLNLGDAHVMTGALAPAVGAYRRTLSLRSDKHAYYGLAYACSRLGDETCATDALVRLRAIDPALAAQVR